MKCWVFDKLRDDSQNRFLAAVSWQGAVQYYHWLERKHIAHDRKKGFYVL